MLKRLSELRASATARGPTTRFPFLDETERSPVLAGRSYLVSAYPFTGKTELMVRVVREWPEEVLYISEEPAVIWEDRATALGDGPDNLLVCHAMGLTLPEIAAVASATNWGVLIVDSVKLLGIRDENAVAEVTAKMRPFIAAQQARNGLIIFLHHTRKGGGNHGEGAAGSHAFLAVVDTALELLRVKEQNQRLLRGESRVDPVESLVYARDVEGHFTVVEIPVQGPQLMDRILTCLSHEWMITSEIKEQLSDVSMDKVVQVLRGLTRQGKVERDPSMAEGKMQGVTYRWRRS